MAAINASNNLTFMSSAAMIASIRSDLESYDAMGLINSQKLYKHIKYMIERLGLSVYKEYEGIIDINSYSGQLPNNFSYLHAAFKVTPSNNSNRGFELPLGKFTYYIQETCSTIEPPCGLHIPSVITPQSKIEYQTVVKGTAQTSSWNNPVLMRLAPRTEKSVYTTNCINVGNGSPYEFSIDSQDNKIYANFQQDSILLQYYGLPLDVDTGLPEVPSQSVLYKAFEDYLKFKIFEDIWLNSDMQDVERKYQKAELNFKESMKEALHYIKLPTFETMIHQVRENKNKFSAYQL